MTKKCWMFAGAFLAATSPATAQILAPPPLPGQQQLAVKLARSIERKNADQYGDLLAENVQVFENGKLIAASKPEWMKSYGPKLKAPGVTFAIKGAYASTGRLMFIEYFNSAASWGTSVPSPCCWSYDTSAYDVRNGKVIKIIRLTGGEPLDLSGN